ncbi:MAG: hypothetical protein LBR66_07815 [Candidatus Symbiothrix sp.]|jgi:hypothetical protein|nr:hypothetical protein [Candidatus Symbiothrix sp.]
MYKISLFLLYLLVLTACVGKQNADVEPPTAEPQHDVGNSVYYWKTTFRLSDEERYFIETHNVKRLYLRYFDVARNADFHDKIIPVPIATVKFIDTVPSNLEVVPVVFIDNSLFYDCDMNQVAENFVKRILTMSATNDINGVREIQLDCDWTKTTEKAYFDFVKNVRTQLNRYTPKGISDISLSATIRLHQLTMTPPPVNRGILMCYNTGGIRNRQTENSILAENDVALYAKHVGEYALPLDVAYPTFSWAVWFSGKKFQALLRELTPDNENLKLLNNNRFSVISGFYQEGKYLSAGDEIRFENSDFQEIIRAKKRLEKGLKKNYSVILYHLDDNNLSKYSEDEINQIYAH